MNKNIYMCGMGGQGIAFLSRILIEACIEAGYNAKGCDTHGMTQRGGTVEAHLRIGKNIHSPIVPEGQGDLVIALERLEALRGMKKMARKGGTLLYYDAVYHPAMVRIEQAFYPEEEALFKLGTQNNITVEKVFHKNLPSPKMQNTALLGRLAEEELIPGVTLKIMEKVMDRLVPESIKEANLILLRTPKERV